ncbi:TetR/AcrR family transcriptional regulator [Trinickia fusca]|uniref:TetR/AcrR family transcriptional regulator n=1 Tax=Trinickia fusca TaxID=2419777 RepID=A0A494XCP9_9BURK|nr:TetR/AcrR family transcriptional regulator [Trinickia fusca]RKP45919.1 TetR/AcrR family transcriptional regulator [Trinickia fusca]
MNATHIPADVRQHILDVAYPMLLSKGFTAVGLTEVLSAARVPKGSFYHYFGSKEAFGEAILEGYFADYLAQMEALFDEPGTAAQRLIRYFQFWLDSQIGDEGQGRCLVVKLGAEVCDLSETMRAALKRGTDRVIACLARGIEAGNADGSVTGVADPQAAALSLYQNWLGASLLAKITRSREPLDMAMANTQEQLKLSLTQDA